MTVECAKMLLVSMYFLSAAFPIAGFARLLWRASRDLAAAKDLAKERGDTVGRIADMTAANSDITAAPNAIRGALVWDICLVGVGLSMGAAAGIWSLWL